MRKPALVKVSEKILKTLPLLGDAELSHIASVCDGLLRLRREAKQKTLGQAQNPTRKETANVAQQD